MITEPIQNGDHNSPCSSSTLPRCTESATSRDDSYQHRLRKSASFSSSSASSLMGSGTSTASLRSSPLGASARTLKSDMINTFQKWETTIESISYVTTKTIAITDPATRPRSQSVSLQIQTQTQTRPHSTTSTQQTLKNGWTTPETGHTQGGSDQKEPQRQTA